MMICINSKMKTFRYKFLKRSPEANTNQLLINNCMLLLIKKLAEVCIPFTFQRPKNDREKHNILLF